MLSRVLMVIAAAAPALLAQDSNPAPAEAASAAAPAKSYLVDVGTRIPLTMVNSVSTKNAAPGDRVYLETSFPIVVDGRIVIPAGSYVMGTITDAHRPGRVKGRGEFRLRFDSLTLPNGVTRDFRATVAGLDGRASETLDRKEGTIRSEGSKTRDATTVATTTVYGSSAGALGGLAAGSVGKGLGIGAAAGAAAGLIGVLVTRGPDAVLARGTSVEMVLDRQISYEEGELDFAGAMMRRSASDSSGPLPSVNQRQPAPLPGGGYPRRIP
jgi:type IV secretion system protein VirB10